MWGGKRERVEDDTKIELCDSEGANNRAIDRSKRRGKRKNLDKDNKQPLQLTLIAICSVDFIHSG